MVVWVVVVAGLVAVWLGSASAGIDAVAPCVPHVIVGSGVVLVWVGGMVEAWGLFLVLVVVVDVWVAVVVEVVGA